jgi:hypothetical protein
MNGGEEQCIMVTGGKARGKQTTMKAKMWIGGKRECGGVNRIGLPQDRNNWKALANTTKNLPVP